MLFASIILSPVAIKNFKKITKKNFIYLLEVAFIGNAIPAYLFAVGQTHISSSLAGILNSITPIATLIIGVLLFRTKTAFLNIIGLVLGLAGSVGLILNSNHSNVDGNMLYSLLVVLAGIMYAFNLNTIKYMLKDMSGLNITAIAFMFTFPVTIVYLTWNGFGATHNIEQAEESLLYIFLLASLSSALAVAGFNILVKFTSAIFASSVTYIIPVFAIMWGLLDGETVLWVQIAWLVVIILGISLVNKKPKSEIKN
jgi:drug/metabolite transporter (DMT)-like permease